MAPRRPRRGAFSPRPTFVSDPLTGEQAEYQAIQPYQARKEYVCPGCNQEIRVGVGHVAVVPINRPEARRHWHKPCYEHASRHGLRNH
jgi:hypothetical protein